MPDILKAVEWAVSIAEDSAHGYDQEHRNGPDYDCSSFVATALHKGGFAVSEYSWTGNLLEQLLANGFEMVGLWDKRQAGDIFLNVRHHVVMCVDESRIVQASINENGAITGGRAGDQTGREIYICPFYVYVHGWDYHLRPPKWSYPKEKRSEILIELVR